MSDTLPQWQIAVREQFDAEQAAQFIEGIDGMLQDDYCEILRQMINEMMLNMREVRMFPMRIQQETDAQVKAAPLCQMEIDGEMRTLTVDDFAQVLLDCIAEGRQMLDVMMFYVMALSEKK
jgi:hypothetical protein